MELLLTLSTWIYCRAVQYALGRDKFETKIVSESNAGTIKATIASSLLNPELSGWNLRELHNRLLGHTPFTRSADGVYSYLSNDGRLFIQLSDTWQSITVNKPADTPEMALQGVRVLLTIERHGNAWRIARSINRPFFDSNAMLLEPLVELLYDRSESCAQYVGGGVMPQSIQDTKFVLDAAQKVCLRKHQWDEANKLVVQQGQEKARKFKPRKNKQQQEEEQPIVSAEILSDGSIVVTESEPESMSSLESKEEPEYTAPQDSAEEKPN